jgi:RNase H-fold protein (predicted Holliday junction resolvase)
MRLKPSIILGLSPGNKSMGYAVMSEEELIDWGVKNFRGKWSNSKKNKILRTIQNMISAFQPSMLAIKVNQTSLSSKNPNMIYRSIKENTKKIRLKSAFLSIEELKRTCAEARNKQEMVKYLKQRFPELNKNLPMKGTDTNSKEFEAIAAIISIS